MENENISIYNDSETEPDAEITFKNMSYDMDGVYETYGNVTFIY